MPFTLTKEDLDSFMVPASKGNWVPFFNAIDPDAHWVVSDPVRNSETLSGTYVSQFLRDFTSDSGRWENLQEWQDIIGPLRYKLKDGFMQQNIEESEVIGNKAINHRSFWDSYTVEWQALYCWIMIFSEETGKVVDIREYMNNALVIEVVVGN